MWQGFTIALREGLESFLIIALLLAYLARVGAKHLQKAVVLGLGTSLLVCGLAGFGLSHAANQPLWELPGPLLAAKRTTRSLMACHHRRRMTGENTRPASGSRSQRLQQWAPLAAGG